jgi:hypothetical protein
VVNSQKGKYDEVLNFLRSLGNAFIDSNQDRWMQQKNSSSIVVSYSCNGTGKSLASLLQRVSLSQPPHSCNCAMYGLSTTHHAPQPPS